MAKQSERFTYRDKPVPVYATALVTAFFIVISIVLWSQGSDQTPIFGLTVWVILGFFVVRFMWRARHGRTVSLEEDALIETKGDQATTIRLSDVHSISRTSVGGSEYGDYRIKISFQGGSLFIHGNEDGSSLANELANRCSLTIKG